MTSERNGTFCGTFYGKMEHWTGIWGISNGLIDSRLENEGRVHLGATLINIKTRSEL